MTRDTSLEDLVRLAEAAYDELSLLSRWGTELQRAATDELAALTAGA